MANVTTIATLGLGVGIAGVTLFAVNLLPALSSSTRTPCGWRCDIRWIPATTASHLLASSAATVRGVLGSGFDSDEAVRRAAYGRRERGRRAALRSGRRRRTKARCVPATPVTAERPAAVATLLT